MYARVRGPATGGRVTTWYVPDWQALRESVTTIIRHALNDDDLVVEELWDNTCRRQYVVPE